MDTLSYGDGRDGSVTISSNTNLSTTAVADGRTYADMIAYRVSTIPAANQVNLTADADGIVVGDMVLLINLQGSTSAYPNVGNWELFTVSAKNGSLITFDRDKTLYYGSTAGQDDSVGSTQKVMLQRIPQYTSFTVNTGIDATASSWNGTMYGVFALACTGTVSVSGTIDMLGRGYRPAGAVRSPGEGIGGRRGSQYSSGNNDLNWVTGGAGSHGYGSGGGGGHIQAGADGHNNYPGTCYGGIACPSASGTLDGRMYLGSSGGSGYDGGNVTRGGGIIFLIANTINVSSGGSVDANAKQGTEGAHGGDGGSAGGSILTYSHDINVDGFLEAQESTGAVYGPGGNGSPGIIATYYVTKDTLQTAPTATEIALLSYKIAGVLPMAADISIYDPTTKELLSTSTFNSSGAYSVSGLTSGDAVDVVARPHSSSYNIAAFKNVTPQQE